AGPAQAFQRGGVQVAAARLPLHRPVVREAERGQGAQLAGGGAGDLACPVHVLHPEQPCPPRAARRQPAAEGGQQGAEVQRAGGRGREAAADGRTHGATLNSSWFGHTSPPVRIDLSGTRSMLKRVILFLATNLAVLALVSIVMSIFGINPQTMGGLLVMAALFGFGGCLISLLSSKWVAKRAAGLHVIERPGSEVERWLVDTVARQAQMAGIGMPEVAIYDAPEINAFATGANRNNALVAVSTGLLRSMDKDEAEAVL